MAELANITPTQLDYFVKLGAFAPDLGDNRKHFSTYEAALVLIAGQLSPIVKDQKVIADALRQLRDFLKVGEYFPKTYREFRKLEIIHQAQKETGVCLTSSRSADEGSSHLKADTELRYLFFRHGYNAYPNWITPNLIQQARELLNVDLESEAALSRSELMFLAKSHSLIDLPGDDCGFVYKVYMQDAFIFATEGRDPNVFLQFAPNADGTAAISVENEPVPIKGRCTWTTINLGNLFSRLAPFADKDKQLIRHVFEREQGVTRDNAPNQDCGLLEALQK